MAAPPFFVHPSSLEHDTGGHPENRRRIEAIVSALEGRDWLGWERREAPEADLAAILRVHPQAHVDKVRDLSARGEAFDLDTPTSPGSWSAAMHAAGGACALAESLLRGEAPCGFAALRPPGHHAEPGRAMGFCLFSSVSIAARHAQAELGAERVFILDWDVHHGNGTNAVFHASSDVLFASLHQWPFYPGTGALDDVGEGEGEGYSINLAMPAGSGEDDWLSMVEHVVAPAVGAFAPQLILISAGYDAHRDDPLADCLLEDGSYTQLARLVRTLGEQAGAPVGAVLEGGYDLGALSRSVPATMEGLTDGEPARSVPAGALVDQARAVVGRYWPL